MIWSEKRVYISDGKGESIGRAVFRNEVMALVPLLLPSSESLSAAKNRMVAHQRKRLFSHLVIYREWQKHVGK
jgi:hypothetical protein